ncbi:MAG TPA: [Fe-Fe] hydrogenase large subunit C-terminal domain-containing protein [Gemmatimonadaceae bacterium]|nr:[Fe-Fe] hydrogenase large subunit C-terminal domain-containing protein [Gemmatimonadaceae bacterium]
MPTSSAAPAVIILGTDAFLAALPATPAQLASACVAAGYAAAVPASWGDELLAEATLRELAPRAQEPVIFGACPSVVERLRRAGVDVERHTIPLVAPPVAAARYVRALYAGAEVRITFAGACSSGGDAAIDERLLPAQLLAALAARGIDPAAQPDEPAPGHRRWRSLPGGVPAPELLFAEAARTLVELDEAELQVALPRLLAARERALFDLGPCAGCACSGAVPESAPRSARAAVAAMEPPRARGDVLDPAIQVAVLRAPSRRGSTPRAHAAQSTPPVPGDAPIADRPAPAAGESAARRRFRTSGYIRAVGGPPPVRREGGEGRPLPRAYHAARRLTTGRLWALTTPPVEPSTGEREVRRAVMLADAGAERRSPGRALLVPLPKHEPYRVPLPPSDLATRLRFAAGVALLILAVVLLVLR